jgi:antitoxin PrlF
MRPSRGHARRQPKRRADSLGRLHRHDDGGPVAVAGGLLTVKVRTSYHVGMKTTVSEKGQITIPKRLRDRLGLRPGTVLDFEESGGRLVGRRLVPADHLDELIGILVLPGSVDAFVAETRGPGLPGSGAVEGGPGPDEPGR